MCVILDLIRCFLAKQSFHEIPGWVSGKHIFGGILYESFWPVDLISEKWWLIRPHWVKFGVRNPLDRQRGEGWHVSNTWGEKKYQFQKGGALWTERVKKTSPRKLTKLVHLKPSSLFSKENHWNQTSFCWGPTKFVRFRFQNPFGEWKIREKSQLSADTTRWPGLP